MEIDNNLLQELSLLREAIERIADALEGIDLKLEDLIETEEFDYFPPNELFDLEEDEEFDEVDEDDFDEDFEEEELHD